MASPTNQSDAVLSVTDLQLSFGSDPILDGATLAVNEGEKVGLVGRNGCGKSSFLRIVAGEEEADSGTISRRQGLVGGYLPQEFQLDENATVEENIRAGASDLIHKIERYENAGELSPAEMDRLLSEIEHADGWNLETRIETLMRELAAPPADRVVSYLSGGEKRRVGLCRALIAQPELIILDEPTNHLDAKAIAWLEGFLVTMPGACLFVTHDRWFLDRICDRVIVFEGGGQVATQEGNYSYYLEKRRNLDAIASASRVKSAKKKRVRNDDGKPRKLKWKEESELEGMEDNILAAESEIEEIEAQLNDPSFYIENSEKAVEMSKDLEQKKEAIRLLYERWEELEAIRLAWESEKGS